MFGLGFGFGFELGFKLDSDSLLDSDSTLDSDSFVLDSDSLVLDSDSLVLDSDSGFQFGFGFIWCRRRTRDRSIWPGSGRRELSEMLIGVGRRAPAH